MRASWRRGFSLGEVVFAVLLLSMMSVLLIGAIPSAVVGVRKTGERAVAAAIAQDTLERLRRDGFGNIADSERPHPVVSVSGTEYTVQVVVREPSPPMTVDEVKDVEVVVSWASGPQREAEPTLRTHSARTLVFRRV